MTNEVEDSISRKMYLAVAEGDVTTARQLLREYPDLRKSGGIYSTWLHDAAGYGNVEMLQMLVNEGFDVNAPGTSRPDGPLSGTLEDGHVAAAKFLLEQGASPNVGRLLIGAINAADAQAAFELVQLLVKHGANVNQCWRFGGDEQGRLFNALSWAIDGEHDEIADYLRAHGAVLPPHDPPRPQRPVEKE